MAEKQCNLLKNGGGIGSLLSGTALANTIASGTITDINSITNVPPGTYLVTGKIRYAANSGGVRDIVISTTSKSGSMDATQTATLSGETAMSLTKLVTLSAQGTIYLTGYSSASTSIGINLSSLYAYKLY